MRTFTGIDLGSTTTKAIVLDEAGGILGRGITNSRSNYDLAAKISRSEAITSARFELLSRFIRESGALEDVNRPLIRLQRNFKKQQHLKRLHALRELCAEECDHPRVARVRDELRTRVLGIIDEMIEKETRPKSLTVIGKQETRDTGTDFFRDRASSDFARIAEARADADIGFDLLLSIFDKAIIRVENIQFDDDFSTLIHEAFRAAYGGDSTSEGEALRGAVQRTAMLEFEDGGVIGTGYGRQRLPFPKESIRSEILCHGLGAHAQFPETRTVLDIGGQDTKAIQVDDKGIVTSFQMNDRCAAGCGRYLGYIADEMSIGLHELGPIALASDRPVKISSTCTVFAGAELRDHMSSGRKQEDILAGLHRAIILRAMSLLARSGGIHDEFTFTGGVANNPAAVKALRQLISENYGERVLNISPNSIYTGALGAAIFSLRAAQDRAAA
jgi:benzoyl-CoA reductase subunit A